MTIKKTTDALRWEKTKANPVLLAKERARIRALYARSATRRARQAETCRAWRKLHPGYTTAYQAKQKAIKATITTE